MIGDEFFGMLSSANEETTLVLESRRLTDDSSSAGSTTMPRADWSDEADTSGFVICASDSSVRLTGSGSSAVVLGASTDLGLRSSGGDRRGGTLGLW